MADEVMADELTLSIAVNKIENYVELLIKHADQYSENMVGITEGAISDEAISSRLIQLGAAVKVYADALTGISGSLKSILGSYMDELEAADTFQYPDETLNRISAILAAFL